MKSFSIDADTPLVPEVIAASITPEKDKQKSLCERARHHYSDNEDFRKSFKRKDPRDVLEMWFKHWINA